MHGVGCTLIIHETREIVVRLPSDRLVHIGLLQAIDPDVVIAVCGLYMAIWSPWAVTRWTISRVGRRQRSPRGFPMDAFETDGDRPGG